MWCKMENCLEEKLLGEICTLKIKNDFSIAEISEIGHETFDVKVLTALNSNISNQEHIEVRIETIDDEIYFYKALIISHEDSNANIILTLKPLEQLHDKNKRNEKRMKIGISVKEQYILYQAFPPIETNWLSAELIDISPGGLQIKDGNFQSIGQLVELKFGEPFFEKNEIVIARIVHTQKEDKNYIYSIQYLNLSDNHQKKIADYIDNIEKKINQALSN